MPPAAAPVPVAIFLLPSIRPEIVVIPVPTDDIAVSFTKTTKAFKVVFNFDLVIESMFSFSFNFKTQGIASHAPNHCRPYPEKFPRAFLRVLQIDPGNSPIPGLEGFGTGDFRHINGSKRIFAS